MKNLILALAAAAVATMLAACGGGGGGGDADATSATATAGTEAAGATTSASTDIASRYAGTWGGCFATGPASSRRETLVITQQGADTASFSFAEVNYAALDCAGTAGATSTDAGTIAFSGTKTMGADTVDKGIVTQADGAQKQVFLATATTLSFGREPGDGGTLDADGYPTTLDANPMTRL